MVVIKPKPMCMHASSTPQNAPPSPPLELDHETPKLSECLRPIKKRRLDMHTHSSKCLKDDDNFLKSAERLWEQSVQCTKDYQALNFVEIEGGTKFARGYDTTSNLTTGVMTGLEIRQQHFRREGQHKMFQERSKKLLDESWGLTVKLMLDSFKRGLSCVNCQQHHEAREFFKKADVLGNALKSVDPNTVDQNMLDKIRDSAARIGEEYLSEVWETECKGIRKIWNRRTGDKKRGRKDSGVDMNKTDPEAHHKE
jgi:hypothetical protein